MACSDDIAAPAAEHAASRYGRTAGRDLGARRRTDQPLGL